MYVALKTHQPDLENNGYRFAYWEIKQDMQFVSVDPVINYLSTDARFFLDGKLILDLQERTFKFYLRLISICYS